MSNANPARPHRWRRRLLWLLALALLARITIAFGAGPAVKALASGLGVELDFERFDLSLLEGRVEVWRLEASVAGEAEAQPAPLLEAHTLAFDLDVLALWGGVLRVRRLELDGARVELARDARGRWNFDALIPSGPSEAAPRDADDEPADVDVPFDLRLPVEVVAARLQDVSIHLSDQSSSEPVDVALTLSVSATDLGTPGKSGRLDVVATSPQFLDLFRLRSAGTNEVNAASWRSQVELSGLRLRPLAPLLEPLGIRPVADRIDAGGELELTAETVGEAREAVAAELDLSGVELLADGVEALGLDWLWVGVAELDGAGLALSELIVEAPRLRAERLPDGSAALGGVAWVGRDAMPSTASASEPVGEAEPEPSRPLDSSARPGFAWSLDELAVTGGAIVFVDASYATPIELEARLDDLRLGPLSSADDAPAGRLELAASCPGVAERIELGGPIDFSAPIPTVELALDLRGLAPERLAPYLAELGIESTLESGRLHLDSLRFTGDEDGGIELALGGLGLRDGAEELGAIDRIRLDLVPGSPPRVEVGGSRLNVTRTAEGELLALGLRVGGSPAAPPRAAAKDAEPVESAPAPSGEPAPFELPILDLPGAQLELTQVVLLDERRPEEPLELGPMTVELSATELAAGEARAYALRLEGRSPIGRDVGAELRLGQASEGALSLSGAWRADGLHLEPLAPWLELAGLEPTLRAGAFATELSLKVAASEGRPRIDLELGPLHLTEGEEELLGLGRLAIEDLRLGDEIAVASVTIDSPRVALRRDADGGWGALGLRMPPPPAESAEDEAPSPSEEGPAGHAPSAPETPVGSPFLRLDRFELTAARARFDDYQLETPHRVELEGELSLSDLAPGPGAPPTTLEGGLRIQDWTLSTRGSLTLDPEDLRASLALAANGLDPEPVAPYLPQGVALTLSEGAARADLEVRVAENDEGGHRLSLRIAGAELRDGERALAALEGLTAELGRLDPEGLVLDVQDLSASGARAEVLRTAGGGVEAFGLRVEPRELQPPGEVEGRSGRTKSRSSRLVSADAEPRLRVDRLALELEELRVLHEVYPDVEPVVLGARLALREPYLFEPDPDGELDEPPPLGLDLEARLVPGIGSLDVDLELSPFTELPRVEALVALRGIDGAGLLTLAPELAGQIDPTELREGCFDARLAAELSWRRRGPLDFDLSNGFGADLLLSDVALRQAEGADVALGLDVLDLRARRIAPRSGLVHLTSLEIDTPRARLRKTDEGIEVAGVLLRLPDARPEANVEALEAEPEDSALPVKEEAAIPLEAAAKEEPTSLGSQAELRVESLVVNGVDVLFEDVSAEPPLVVPLDSLGVELRGFTTRAFSEPIPLRLTAAVGAGAVDLPKRRPGQSLIGGITSGAKNLLNGSSGQVELEQRPILQEATVSAHLAIVPQPEGWLRTSVTGFELQGLSGIASESGIRIDDGVVDLNARLKFDGEAGGRLDSVTSFRHLSISEPDGGPISRFLSLPAPLGTVLFALENENGEHRIPLSFDFGEGGSVSTATMASKASTALLKLITEALTSAPMRTVDGVTSAIGLGGLLGGGDSRPEGAGLTATIPFGAGTVRIDAAAMEGLEELVEAMEEDDLLELRALHVFGPGDFERAGRLASPSSEEAATLLSSLRRRRDELLRQREELVASARAQLLLGQAEPFAATRQHLVEVSRDLGLAEDGIDVVADLLRPTASKRSDRRTRDAALAIARARLEALSRKLLAAGVPYERLDVRPPRAESVAGEGAAGGRIELVTRGGTPPKSFFRRIFGWVGL